MKLTLLILFPFSLLSLLPLSMEAQYRRNCSTMDHLEEQIEANPAVKYRMRDVEIRTTENVRAARADMLGEVVIPVVVHVVYNTPTQNISDEQIFSQIDVLNEDFGRLNRDRFNTPSVFSQVAVSSKIRFRLANRDPYGNPTNGITRKATQQRLFSPSDNGVKYSAMGGVDAWDTQSYLNIWVTDLGNGMLGYAQFPGGGRTETDGVVIGYKFFGTTGTVVSPFDLGRTCTHEVGHWLNLKHIWGDGPCNVDDLVADTPPVGDAHYGCVTQATACDGSPAMVSNFMDYTDDACMNLFSFGQAERMRSLFAPGGFRRTLLFSNALTVEAAPVATTAPELLNATDVTESSARLSWSPIQGAEAYTARFRALGTTDWATRDFSRTFVNATQLRSCTDYEFQIATIVDGVRTDFSETRVFRTMGCQEEAPIVGVNNPSGNVVDYPTMLFVSNETSTQAQLNWAAVSGALTYKVQYKAAGSNQVFGRTLRDNFVMVPNLVPGQRYFYRVRAEFGAYSGPYSQVESFIAKSSQSARMAVKAVPPDYFSIEIPASQTVAQVSFELTEPTELLMEILDANGEIAQSFNPYRAIPNSPIELTIGTLPSGTYQLVITDPDGFDHVRPFSIR